MAEMDIKEVKEKVLKGLEHARWQLLNKFPFTGEMLLRFSIIPTYDCRLDTAATDGTKIYFDCEFYSTLNDSQREFVLAHEVWHNIFLHFERMGTRIPMMWNIATDMEINHMLKNEGLDVLKDACMPDAAVAGKNAEDIYAYLMKNQDPNQNQNSDDDEDDGEGGEDGEDGQSSSSNGKNKNGKSSSKKNDKNGNQFDKHIYEGDSAGPGEHQNGKWGEKGFDPDYNPSMKNAKEVANKIKDAVCSVAQNIERKQGHLPAGIDNIVKEMLKPEINWKEALSMFVTSCLDGDHSWKRISRHAFSRGMYLPGRNSEKIKVACAVDTSGSYLADLPKFLGELNSLLHSFGNYEVTLIQCDAEIQDVQKYDNSNPFKSKDFKTKGGGGTSFKPVFKWLRETGEDEYNCIIYFTDGYGDAPTYPPSIPVLWVLTSDGYEKFCEWGQKMKFKPQNNR